jgi:hypothetical protein
VIRVVRIFEPGKCDNCGRERDTRAREVTVADHSAMLCSDCWRALETELHTA